MEEFFVLHIILIMGLIEKKVHTMVHIISRIIRGGHRFHDVFIRMKYGRTGGREST